MLTNLLGVLALASTALGISINKPNDWTTTGPNMVSWVAVSTDPASCAAILVNQNTALLSASVLLEADISTNPGSGGTFTVYADPDSPFPAGPEYQVNFIWDENSPHHILAQTDYFTIKSGGTSSLVLTTRTVSQTRVAEEPATTKSTTAAGTSRTATAIVYASSTSSSGASAASAAVFNSDARSVVRGRNWAWSAGALVLMTTFLIL